MGIHDIGEDKKKPGKLKIRETRTPPKTGERDG
jgi:hypothetical protein